MLVIPAATIERVAATLAERGHIPRGYLDSDCTRSRSRALALVRW